MSEERSFEVIHEAGRAPIKAWIRGVELESHAREQLLNVASLPFIHHHVAVMPDVHWGMGATIGSVIPTLGAVVPAAVGVDLGCGMAAVRTSLRAEQRPDSLGRVRTAIEAAVPHGRTNNGRPGDKGAWSELLPEVVSAWEGLDARFQAIVEKHPGIGSANTVAHLGTLGTGNHFIEVCLEVNAPAEGNFVWVMVHSGSRGVGNRIGTYFIERAKRHMEHWFIQLPDADLAYLPEGAPEFGDYVRAVGWAQDFAATNRAIMMKHVLAALGTELGLRVEPTEIAVDCHHNYIRKERHFGKDVWITRKGAVSAKEGELGIIPGSMGAKSFIVRGKGNPESFHTCSHGAGRAMSRGEAKRRFTVEDHIAATAGVECRKDVEVIDETPAAYKSIEAVMAAQSDLVDVVHTLRQVVCVKG